MIDTLKKGYLACTRRYTSDSGIYHATPWGTILSTRSIIEQPIITRFWSPHLFNSSIGDTFWAISVGTDIGQYKLIRLLGSTNTRYAPQKICPPFNSFDNLLRHLEYYISPVHEIFVFQTSAIFNKAMAELYEDYSKTGETYDCGSKLIMTQEEHEKAYDYQKRDAESTLNRAGIVYE